MVFSVGAAFLWNEYKEVQNKNEELTKKIIEMKDAEIALGKEKSRLELKLKEKEFELARKERILDEEKKEIEIEKESLKNTLSKIRSEENSSISDKEKELEALISQYEKNLEKVKRLHSLYSREARTAKVEDEIINLMKEFSRLGVDIHKPNWCDEDYTKRYYQAKAIVKQISTLNSEYAISQDYRNFVQSNTRSFTSSSDGECEANNALNSDAVNSAG